MDTITDSNKVVRKKFPDAPVYFHMETPEELCRVLVNLMIPPRTRVRVFFGDPETGEEWSEENDVVGYLGRSTGTIKIPLLVYNKRSSGGGALSDDRILKIQTTHGRVLWTHPNYKPPVWASGLLDKPLTEPHSGEVYVAQVTRNGVLYSRHTSIDQAYRFASFMRGERGSK